MVVAAGLSAACSSRLTDCCESYEPGRVHRLHHQGGAGEALLRAAAASIRRSERAQEDATRGCRELAWALGAQLAPEKPLTVREDLFATCAFARAEVERAARAGVLRVESSGGGCRTSMKAHGLCTARCVEGNCPGGEPLRCERGPAVQRCSGGCTPSPGEASVLCDGRCEGACSAGRCSPDAPDGRVECHGHCDGACLGVLSAEGLCEGPCAGSCGLQRDRGVACAGRCEGRCEGRCRPPPSGLPARCSGICAGAADELQCTGALLGGCTAGLAGQSCAEDCAIVAGGEAECAPVAVTVTSSASASRARDAIEEHLPAILTARARASLGGGRGRALGARVAAGPTKVVCRNVYADDAFRSDDIDRAVIDATAAFANLAGVP